jgi:hypothetical protein
MKCDLLVGNRGCRRVEEGEARQVSVFLGKQSNLEREGKYDTRNSYLLTVAIVPRH